jgi:hypothetical protein
MMTASQILNEVVTIKNRLDSQMVNSFLANQNEGVQRDFKLYRAELQTVADKLSKAPPADIRGKLQELADVLNKHVEALDHQVTALNDAPRLALATMELVAIGLHIIGTIEVGLVPSYLLDDQWNIAEELPPVRLHFFPTQEPKSEKETIVDAIRAIRIEVAASAESTLIKSEDNVDYLKSELGMNIVVPVGAIEELRFQIVLKGMGDKSEEVVAIDGFPKDVIEEQHIIGGKIRLGLTKSFKFIPIVGPVISDLVDVSLNPWEFRLGNLRRVSVNFSGGLTAQPEWYLRRNGIKNEVRVALTLRKPKGVLKVTGDVQAFWIFNPGFLKRARVGTDKKLVQIYGQVR